MDCSIEDCVRDTVNKFCSKHAEAHKNIEDNFPKWQEAYGEKFSRREYIQRLAEDLEIGAGEWVIDVAVYLQKNEM